MSLGVLLTISGIWRHIWPVPRAASYVSVLAFSLDVPRVRLDILEVKPQKASLVSVNAAMMAAEIATRGSVAVYGMYFDHDRPEVKRESRPTISRVATLIEQNQKLQLIVAGHTDNNGRGRAAVARRPWRGRRH